MLYVRDVAVSKRFYMDHLGFSVVTEAPGAAFLQAPGSDNDHDLGLFEIGAAAGASTSGRGTVGLYHLAWEVETLGDLVEISTTLRDAGALVGASDHGSTKSLYARDPDGLEFEVVWLIPAADLTDEDLAGRDETTELQLPRELARFGADARSGLGISRSAD